MTVLLVRHARAGRRESWQGDDRLRPLTVRGRAQAIALAEVIRPWVSADTELVSSPWLRCIQTLEALPSTGAPVGAIRIDEVLGEGMGSKAAAEVLGSWVGVGTAVLCTHGDVIDEVLSRLSDAGIDLGRRPTAPKGSVWVLEGSSEVRSARYLPPPG